MSFLACGYRIESSHPWGKRSTKRPHAPVISARRMTQEVPHLIQRMTPRLQPGVPAFGPDTAGIIERVVPFLRGWVAIGGAFAARIRMAVVNQSSVLIRRNTQRPDVPGSVRDPRDILHSRSETMSDRQSRRTSANPARRAADAGGIALAVSALGAVLAWADRDELAVAIDHRLEAYRHHELLSIPWHYWRLYPGQILAAAPLLLPSRGRLPDHRSHSPASTTSTLHPVDSWDFHSIGKCCCDGLWDTRRRLQRHPRYALIHVPSPSRRGAYRSRLGCAAAPSGSPRAR